MKITGYMHVACMGHWREVVNEQLAKIKSSGLYDKTDRICVTVVGADHVDALFDDDKFDVQCFSDLTEYEFPSLRRIREDDGDLVWYIHTKGVSRNENRTNWRRYMEYFIIERHEDCIAALVDHDVCGVDLMDVPFPHFSGNFWWATGHHVRSLPDITDFVWDDTIMKAIEYSDLEERHSAEFFILSRECRSKMLFWSGAYHDYTDLSPEKYRGVERPDLERVSFEKREYRRRYIVVLGNHCHFDGDTAYHNGDKAKAISFWKEGAELGNEQCRKNLEWAETW